MGNQFTIPSSGPAGYYLFRFNDPDCGTYGSAERDIDLP